MIELPLEEMFGTLRRQTTEAFENALVGEYRFREHFQPELFYENIDLPRNTAPYLQLFRNMRAIGSNLIREVGENEWLPNDLRSEIVGLANDWIVENIPSELNEINNLFENYVYATVDCARAICIDGLPFIFTGSVYYAPRRAGMERAAIDSREVLRTELTLDNISEVAEEIRSVQELYLHDVLFSG